MRSYNGDPLDNSFCNKLMNFINQDKGLFAEAMDLKITELPPVVISIGYPSESRRGVDSFIRFMAGSKDRRS